VPKILKITVGNHGSRHMHLNQQNVILKTAQLLKLNVIPNWKTNHKVPLKLFHSVCLKRFFSASFLQSFNQQLCTLHTWWEC